MRGLIVDNFAGGGGASLGIEQALGRGVERGVKSWEARFGRQSPHGLGIILDDSPRVIRRLIAVPVKCQPNGGKTVITIDELSP